MESLKIQAGTGSTVASVAVLWFCPWAVLGLGESSYGQ